MYLFTDDINVFMENRKESTKNLIAVIALHFYILANANLKLKYNILSAEII